MSIGTGSVGPTRELDLIGIVTREITPEVVERAALQTGEDPERTRSALSTSVPSVLATLSDVASSDGGAAHLKHVIDERIRMGTTASSAFGSSTGREQGVALFDDEAGDLSGSISAAVARSSGIKQESAHELLGGVTSVAMLALGKSTVAAAPDTLKRVFRDQRGDWLRRLPGPLASLFGERKAATALLASQAGRAVGGERVVTGPAIRRLETAGRRGWIAPLLLLAALALVAIPLIRGLSRPTSPSLPTVPEAVVPPPEMVPLALPNGESVMLPRGSATYELANFLAGAQPTPRRFTLAPLNFDFGSTRLTPESMATIKQLSGILGGYPTTTIRVESHTDNVGTAQSNLDLSMSRSEAVKGLLASRGVDVSRVEIAGLGQENPIASNDTTDGRAKNRRTDIVVTGR